MAFWGKDWALGAKVWDPILKVQEPSGDDDDDDPKGSMYPIIRYLGFG